MNDVHFSTHWFYSVIFTNILYVLSDGGQFTYDVQILSSEDKYQVYYVGYYS